MRTIFSLLTSVLLTLTSFAQTTIANEYPAWEQPVIKKLIAKDPTVIGYGVKGNDKFINIAILDKKVKMLYWISCEGYIIEASQLTDIDYNFLITKKLDPFQLHQLLYKRDIQITDNAIEKIRFPKYKFYSSNDPNYDKYITQLLHSKQYDTLKTAIQKLSSLYKSDQHYIYHLIHTEILHPLKAQADSIYKKYLTNIKKGSIDVSEHTDSIGIAVFYNKDELSPIYKAVLDIPSATLYFWRTDQTIFDSISINRKRILKLIDEGTDVFALYQNYNLWRLTTFDNTVHQLHDYYTNTKANPRQKKATEILLASFEGGKEALANKLHEAEEKVLQKLNTLFNVDKYYLEQTLLNSFAYSTIPIQYGEYIEGKGLQLSAPTTPYSSPTISTVTRGDKLYQLTDQRGNVMVVITDKKIPHDDNHDGIVDYYTAEVVKATDYSSFGSPLPGRTFEIAEYKYGYNGKENDKEIGYQDYGLRMYDPNIGRFISPDPLSKAFPFYSPYQFAGNSPIKFIDLDGGEPISANSTNGEVKKLGGDAWTRLWAIHGAYFETGGDKSYFAHSETETKGSYVPVDNSRFLSNSNGSHGVNTNSQFLLSNESSFSSEKDLVNTLLGDFFWGNGPENIVFPHNGKFSKSLSSSIMVGETLAKWDGNNRSQTDFNWTMDKRGRADALKIWSNAHVWKESCLKTKLNTRTCSSKKL